MSDACRFPGCTTGDGLMDGLRSRLCPEHWCEANAELDRNRPPGEMLTWEKACGIVRAWLAALTLKRGAG